MKNFRTVEGNIKYLLKEYPNLRDKTANEVSALYALIFGNFSKEEVNIYLKIQNELPALSSIVRLLTKVRTEYPELDSRKNVKKKEREFKQYLSSFKV